jgi:signal transduction histidine kinase/DNA-binding response OmpR family regulator
MSSGPIRVLLVEDNQGDARLLRELLKETGRSQFDLVHVDRLSEALRVLRAEPFPVILLDLSLPDAHGLDTIGRLRCQAAGVPIVILTGLNDEEIAVRAVEEGAQDYLIKGQVDGHLLARSLRYAIQRHRAEETLKERNRELLILQKISETILSSLDLRAVLESILEQTMVSESFDLGNVRLLDPNRATLEVMVSRGYRDPENISRYRAFAQTAERTRSNSYEGAFKEPCVEEQVQQCAGYRTLKNEGVESFVMVPVRADSEVLGSLLLASRARRNFKPEEVNLLQTIGNQLGVAVQKSRLFEETARQAVELERAAKLQADFAAMIAHDLRSPLMNISGAAEVMMHGMFGTVNEEQKQWLAKILANSRSLVNLVSDFLDVSKLEAGYVDVAKEAVDLCGLIQKTLDNFLILAQEKQIVLTNSVHPSMPSIHADPRRLDQVLSNLLSNAVKFTKAGGVIEVGAGRGNETHAQIWVKDTGVGIPRTEIGHLFEKYRQCSNIRESGHKGTGLGLVICKMVVQAHGGRIWVESEEGKGSTFYFTLPLNPI